MRQRLSRVWRPLGPVSWYLEADHLLAADQRWFNLQYRRFYYEDIRSVVVWRTHAIWISLAIEGALGGVATWLAWLWRGTAVAGVAAAATAALLAVEVSAGPRAQARIETQYSSYRTPMVRRWRQGQAVLTQIDARVSLPAKAAAE
ncbi:MAG: hypothetical protein ACRD1L_11020 [Terriglobales bacterium]